MSERATIEAAWSAVNSATASKDASRAVTAVSGAVGVGLLQAAGPAALLAVRRGVATSDALAASLIEALRHRDWAGDTELVELLSAEAASTGTGRSRLEIDLEGLADVLGDEGGGYLDLTTGTSSSLEMIEIGQADDLSLDDDPDSSRWLEIPGAGSRDAYRDMVDFTHELTDTRTRADLESALDGKGAFRRFQAALNRHENYRVHWRVFSTERRIGRARAWLAEQGYDAVP